MAHYLFWQTGFFIETDLKMKSYRRKPVSRDFNILHRHLVILYIFKKAKSLDSGSRPE